MSFFDAEDSVLTVMGLSLNGEVVVLGEVAALDVETVEPMVMADVFLPDLGNFSLLQFLMVFVVLGVSLDLFDVQVPVSIDLGGCLNDLIAHSSKLIYLQVLGKSIY